MHINKKIMSAVVGLLMSATPIMAAPQFKYIEKKETTNLAEGLTHEFITSFTSDGFRGINVLKFNLSESSLRLVPLFNNTTTGKGMAISKMVQNKNAVAGVNGDFFNYKPFFPLGIAIENGELITSNSDASNPTPSIVVGKDNSLTLGRIEVSMSLKVGDKTLPVGMVNKPNNYGSTGIYTSRWGQKTRGGKANSQTEVAIENGVVIDRLDQGGPMNIPKNGYVVNIKDGMYLPSVGESAEFVVSGINLGETKFAIGAGSQILKDGGAVNTHINISGRHPRTAIGFNKNTLDCVILTVDGRSIYHGMTTADVSELLLSMGMTDGFNLDGGGSTTMAIKNVNTDKVDVVNYIESERAVANGVGIMSTSEKGAPAKIEIESDFDKIFKNSSKQINIKVFDEKGNPLKVNQAAIAISSSVPATINGTWFKPTAPGDATVSVTYGNLSATKNVKVLDAPAALLLPKDTIALGNGGKYKMPDVTAIDAVGNRSTIRAEELSLNVVGGVGTMSGTVFTRNKNNGNGAIEVSFGGAKNRIIISKSARKESINALSNTTGLSASAKPNGARASLQRIKDKKSHAVRLWYNFEKVTDSKTASMNLKNTRLPNDSSELSIFVRDIEDQKLTAKISIAGEDMEVDFTKHQTIDDFSEWRAKLPGENGIYLKSIDISESEGKGTKGNVDFKYLAAVVSPDTSKMYNNLRTDFMDHLRNDNLNSSDIAIVVRGTKASGALVTKNTENHKVVSVMGGVVNANNVTKNRITTDNNTIIANFKNNKGGLRATDINQWNELLNSVKTSAASNVIVTIDGGSKDELGLINPIEREFLKETLEEMVKAGKRVFLITNLKHPTASRFEEGVRYMNINPAENEINILNINRIGDNVIYGISTKR